LLSTALLTWLMGAALWFLMFIVLSIWRDRWRVGQKSIRDVLFYMLIAIPAITPFLTAASARLAFRRWGGAWAPLGVSQQGFFMRGAAISANDLAGWHSAERRVTVVSLKSGDCIWILSDDDEQHRTLGDWLAANLDRGRVCIPCASPPSAWVAILAPAGLLAVLSYLYANPGYGYLSFAGMVLTVIGGPIALFVGYASALMHIWGRRLLGVEHGEVWMDRGKAVPVQSLRFAPRRGRPGRRPIVVTDGKKHRTVRIEPVFDDAHRIALAMDETDVVLSLLVKCAGSSPMLQTPFRK